MVRARQAGDGRTLEFFDGVANDFVKATVTDPTSIERRAQASFPIDVDCVFALRTKRLELARTPSVILRDGDGEPVRTAHRDGLTRHGGGETLIEICTPLKLYLEVTADLTVDCSEGRTAITLQRSQRMRIGVRAAQDVPVDTVTISEDVADLFAAVSTFGSAMSSMAPSRSFPTERGHPPLIEVGDELTIPDGMAPPETDITIEAPATYLHAAMAAPLVYYLGATLRPGNAGALRIDGTTARSLGRGQSFGQACTDVLGRVLLLDGVIAAERDYGIVTGERITLGKALGVDWADLTDCSLAGRIQRYLDLPTDAIAPLRPEFQPAYVVPTPRMAASLPYLAYDLASIRPPARSLARRDGPALATDGGLTRAPSDDPISDTGRSGGQSSVRAIGHRLPVGQHPAYPEAFHNRIDRVDADESITMRLVCNEPRMRSELADVRSVYAAREDYPIDLEIHEELTRDELATQLRRHADFFHYVGHIDANGFACQDDHLDVRDLDDVATELFFLNSCESDTQAVGLIAAGACGGIATNHRVRNRAALNIGTRIARLLARGYPIGVSLGLVRREHPVGDQYTIVGDPKTDVTGTDSGIPYTCHVEASGDGTYAVTMDTHLAESVGPGSLCSFHLGEEIPYFIHPTRRTFALSRTELIRFLEREEVPVRYDDQSFWSEECIDALPPA